MLLVTKVATRRSGAANFTDSENQQRYMDELMNIINNEIYNRRSLKVKTSLLIRIIILPTNLPSMYNQIFTPAFLVKSKTGHGDICLSQRNFLDNHFP